IRLSTIAPISHDGTFEQAVSLSASLVQHLAQHGYVIQLIVGVDGSTFGQGDAHLHELLRMLALCQRRDPSGEFMTMENLEPDRREDDGGTEIVVQSWRGSEDHQPRRLTLLINGQPVDGVLHGL
ncbi:MAG: hypothetical protein HC801_11040, partial [Nitrospira sp.]|nr:hypothetical protein [Nitrospira sp.]